MGQNILKNLITIVIAASIMFSLTTVFAIDYYVPEYTQRVTARFFIWDNTNEPSDGFTLLSEYGDFIININNDVSLIYFEDFSMVRDILNGQSLAAFLDGQTLTVAYTIVQDSFPMRTTPISIRVLSDDDFPELPEKEEINDEFIDAPAAKYDEFFWAPERPFISDNEVLIFVDGNYLHTKNMVTAPFIENGRAMVPFRALAEAFEFGVNWAESEQRITLTRGAFTIIMYIGSPFIYVNGEELLFYDAMPMIRSGRTFLPIRRLAEVLEIDVEWDDGTRTAVFTRRVVELIAEGDNVFGSAAHRPSAAITQDGLTISVLQTIADRYGVYLMYEIIADRVASFNEGTAVETFLMVSPVLELPYVPSLAWARDESINMMHTEPALSTNSHPPIILESSTNRLLILQHFNARIPIAERDVRLEIYHIGDIRGPWELRWQLRFEDGGITLRPNLPIDILGQDVIISRVSISPISATVVFDGNNFHERAANLVTILMRDGREIAFGPNSSNASLTTRQILSEDSRQISERGTSAPESILSHTLFYRFDYIIDIEDVVGVHFGDVMIPVN
ncbi:MAG: copper amine oxidase N-terminal domain-containing protein [Defluviitaleaceae bacterium]|nr:copper amine oxidase N-terminal domain-containing protein [Defluviitaleaceae bacterium]